MIKNFLLFTLLAALSFSCVQTPANLKDENGQYMARNGNINIHLDKQAKDLFYPSLQYLADDLGAQITHSSKTSLSIKGKFGKGYEVSLELEQKLDNVCEIRIYSTRHKRPDNQLSDKVAAELLPLLQ
ncbi:hypothetical protein PQO03_06815 [Lentisphaera profundi]|uniref:DUF3568 family protein n=1 Tax=Lentisphaera profundi TaxID=1658616 RepID=A0ABY7VRB4_9BACT|nr:hypothetical protein [Lentisphaera profundi]WDE95427.1 hypothetical protein PQO03_06815 [Lentisphaera profundi]